MDQPGILLAALIITRRPHDDFIAGRTSKVPDRDGGAEVIARGGSAPDRIITLLK
jgi:hypothetical protein